MANALNVIYSGVFENKLYLQCFSTLLFTFYMTLYLCVVLSAYNLPLFTSTSVCTVCTISGCEHTLVCVCLDPHQPSQWGSPEL